MENLTGIIKNWKFQLTQNSATVYNSFSSCAVWVHRKAGKRKTDDTMDSKKDEKNQ